MNSTIDSTPVSPPSVPNKLSDNKPSEADAETRLLVKNKM